MEGFYTIDSLQKLLEAPDLFIQTSECHDFADIHDEQEITM